MNSTETASALFERKRTQVIERLKDFPPVDKTRQKHSASSLAGIGHSIVASHTAHLAYRLNHLTCELTNAIQTGSQFPTTVEVLIPESAIAFVLDVIKPLGLKLESNKERPKEPFDLYRFNLRFFDDSLDKAGTIDALQCLSMALFAEADKSLDIAMVYLM